jgi:hypothetical protein
MTAPTGLETAIEPISLGCSSGNPGLPEDVHRDQAAFAIKIRNGTSGS